MGINPSRKHENFIRLAISFLALSLCSVVLATEKCPPAQSIIREIAGSKNSTALPQSIKPEFQTLAAHELKVAGQIIPSGGQIPKLETGSYLYLIDSKGNIVFSQRAPLKKPEGSAFMTTHQALWEKMRSASGTNPDEIVAAGEFRILNGQVYSVSNKSGRFRGGAENLDFAVNELTDAGLPIQNTTMRADYSNPTDPGVLLEMRAHDVAKSESEKVMEVRRNPKLSKQMREWERVYAEVARLVPDPTSAGIPDSSRLFDNLDYAAMARAKNYKDMDLANGAIIALNRIRENGFEPTVVLMNQVEHMRPEEVLDFLLRRAREVAKTQ